MKNRVFRILVEFNRFFKGKRYLKFLFIFSGLASTAWFLIRVIPKPSRAAYPCMRTTAPLMSAFILYLLGLSGSFLAFKKAVANLRTRRIAAFTGLLILAVFASTLTLTFNKSIIQANAILPDPNQPIGVGKGIYPGRVVWEWDPEATNENCTNAYGDAWDLEKNTSYTVVDSLVQCAIIQLTGASGIEVAWDSLFIYFNRQHGKAGKSYSEGEKIFIKTNFVGGHRNRLNDDHSRKDHSRYGNSQTSPQVILSVLSQLIGKCGVPQENIYVGDPSKNMFKNTYDMLHGQFPGVHIVAELDEMEREMAVPGDTAVIFYSDKGTILGKSEDYLCRQLEEADYLVNIAALKGHMRAGITLCTKNHFGSHMSADASHLHPGLVQESTGFGKYRVLVDLMGHEQLGGKTILFLVDGLWAGADANLRPDKWKMSPFDNDWTSSVFVSQDPVALEAVCFDFLRTEYTVENTEFPYPQTVGTEDYLIQAADPLSRPSEIFYDPEGDGTTFGSLGVYEHWNNSVDKEYSRDLGAGPGIELIKPGLLNAIPSSVRMIENAMLGEDGIYISVYPNPAANELFTRLENNYSGSVSIKIFGMNGQLLSEDIAKKTEDVLIHRIDLSGLKDGEYLISVSYDGQSTVKRIMKAGF